MDSLIILLAIVVLLSVKWIVFAVCYVALFLSSFRKKKRNIITAILAIPHGIENRILRFRGGGDRFVMYNIGFIPSCRIRRLMYKSLGVTMGKYVTIHFKAEIRAPHKLQIGDGSIIGDNTLLDARSNLTIGKNVNFSSNVSVYTLQHNHRDPMFSCDFGDRKLSVEIDDRAWIGCNVIVLPGVHIHEGAVCCAGSVVTKDVGPFEIVAGVPAKKIGERNRDLKYEFHGGSRVY